MSPRRTLVLLGLAGALAGFIAFVERPLRLARYAVEDTRIFPNLRTADISAVEVQIPGQPTLRADRTNTQWQITRPLSRLAEKVWIEALLTNVAALRWENRLKASEFDGRTETMREFGLADPRVLVSFHFPDGQLQLLVGTNTAAGDQIYVRQGGGSDVYLVSPALLRLLPGKPSEWRNRRLFPETFAGVDHIRVRSATGGYDLERSGPQQPWRMTFPWNARADNGRIFAALDAFRTNFIQHFVADGLTDLQSYGLQTPELEISVGHGTNLSRGILFGSPTTNTPPLIHAKHPGEDSVFTIGASAMTAWRGLPQDFLDRRVVDADPDAIVALEVASPDEPSFRLTGGKEGAWTLTGATQATADIDLLAQVFRILTAPSTELERAVVTDFTPYGLESPLVEYTVTVAGPDDSRRTIKARFGAGTNGVFYVHRRDEDAVKVVPPGDFLRLPRASWQFRDRQIWNFPVDDVALVTVAQRGIVRKLVRNGEGDWSVAKGAAEIINPFGVEETVSRLGALKAEFWTQRPDEASLKTCGFEAENYTLSIELKSGRTLRLALGRPSPYHNPYALTEVDGGSMIFEFPLELHYNFVREFLSIFKTGTL